MKLWLTRQGNGLYMLTILKPVVETQLGSDKKDVYLVPGEPIGIRNICDRILTVIGNSELVLPRLESIQIQLTGEITDE